MLESVKSTTHLHTSLHISTCHSTFFISAYQNYIAGNNGSSLHISTLSSVHITLYITLPLYISKQIISHCCKSCHINSHHYIIIVTHHFPSMFLLSHLHISQDISSHHCKSCTSHSLHECNHSKAQSSHLCTSLHITTLILTHPFTSIHCNF